MIVLTKLLEEPHDWAASCTFAVRSLGSRFRAPTSGFSHIAPALFLLLCLSRALNPQLRAFHPQLERFRPAPPNQTQRCRLFLGSKCWQGLRGVEQHGHKVRLFHVHFGFTHDAETP